MEYVVSLEFGNEEGSVLVYMGSKEEGVAK
jgi:hypothetical protein